MNRLAQVAERMYETVTDERPDLRGLTWDEVLEHEDPVQLDWLAVDILPYEEDEEQQALDYAELVERYDEAARFDAEEQRRVAAPQVLTDAHLLPAPGFPMEPYRITEKVRGPLEVPIFRPEWPQ